MTQGADGAERSTAIVLFTDLVGSTELRSRLGEDAAEELRHRHDALVAAAVEARRGNIVKNLGDGVMATFTGASDAVGAAVAIQQAIGRHNRSSAAALEVRIGISAGDVVFEGGDCFGTPVIEAARLCGAAAGGQILASEMVRWLARSSGGAFTPIGSLELKGLPEAIPAIQVEWEPLPESAVPLPAFLTDIGRIFVGRDAELERLGQFWKEAAAGERRVALLAGEPGVGKTRLAAELATRAHEEGGAVLAGRCDEGLGVPYQPFVEALRHFVDHTPPADLLNRLGRYGGELARLVPELSEQALGLPAPLRSDPETERYRLFDAVAAWLDAASVDEPLLLVLDDLQWAAKPTLLLLRHIVRAADVHRLLVVGTYRDTDLDAGHPLVEVLADLRRDGAVDRYSLRGLDPADVAAYLKEATGHELNTDDVALAGAIYEETEGNPFFVREVLRHLSETGALQRPDDGWTRSLSVERPGIPEGIREVVGKRLSRLSPDTNRVLRTAAVIGVDFQPAVVGVAGEFPSEALMGGLEEAVAARLVLEAGGGRYRFAHALVRDTVYGSLSSIRRSTLHRAVAGAIETVHEGDLEGHLPALAHHWSEASTSGSDLLRAAQYAARAGDRALAQLAHHEAAAFYSQAVELFDAAGVTSQEGQRLDVLISLGEAQRRGGDGRYRETLLMAARLAQRARDGPRLAKAALANSRGFWSVAGGVDSDRIDVLRTALGMSDSEASPTRARLLVNLSAEVEWLDGADYQQLADEALALARRLDDSSTLAHVLRQRSFTFLSHPDTLAQRLAETAELLALAEQLGDPVLSCLGLASRFVAALEAGDIREARRCLAGVEGFAEELNQPLLRWLASLEKVTWTMVTGDYGTGEQLLTESLALSQAASESDGRLFHGVQLGVLRFLQRGRVTEVEDVFNDMIAAAPRIVAFRATLALQHAESGRTDEAREALPQLCGELEKRRDVSWSRGVAMTTLLCAEIGDESIAERLHGLFAPYSGRFVASLVAAFGAIDLYLGILSRVMGRFDEAEYRFAAAAALHETMGAAPWLAHTRLEWARMLATRRQPGDADRARELLGQALDSARELGLGGVERGAVELLSSP